MDRFTKKGTIAGREVRFVSGDHCFDAWAVPKKFMGEAIDRLAAYEDTGLEPEEITDLMAAHGTAIGQLAEYHILGPIAHLRDLVEAEKAGRLIVPPCKKGDELWTYCIVPDCGLDGVLSSRVVSVSIVDGRVKFKLGYREFHTEYSVEDIGKTVFLTRPEAEAALEAAKRPNDNPSWRDHIGYVR